VNLLRDATPETNPDERVLGVLKLLLDDGVKPETLKELKTILAAR
jgi:hypothetical protein